MKISCMGITLALALLATVHCTTAFAHGTDTHGAMVSADDQMKKLHVMMPIFSIASAELESAIQRADAAGAKVQAERILAAVSDLKISRPHKNLKLRKKFVELATALEVTVASTADMAAKGDFASATIAFKKVEKTCTACHATFRD